MGMVRTIPRLQNLICPVDRVIAFGETAIDFCGVPLGILRTPGHARTTSASSPRTTSALPGTP